MANNAQLEILKEAVELLGKLTEESGARFSAVERRIFAAVSSIVTHGMCMTSLVTFLLLGNTANCIIYLLSRPALESLFKLAAAVETPDFAAQKVVAEIKEEQGKIKKWIETRPAWQSALKPVEAGLLAYEQELRTRYGVTGQNQWNAKQVANEGKMSASYAGDYFLGSQHIHAVLKALVDREAALYIPAGLYGLTQTVTHTCALLNKALAELENCFAKNVFESAADLNKRALEAYENNRM